MTDDGAKTGETCGTCRFWGPAITDDLLMINPEAKYIYGNCHRRAPTNIAPARAASVFNAGVTDPAIETWLARWPLTRVTDWCGEYEALETDA